MAPPKNKAAACQGRGGDQQKTTTHKYSSAALSASPAFIDRHGHLHSEAVLRNWSPAALKALGIRRLDGGEL